MSALTFLVRPKGLHVFSDTAVYHAVTGEIVRFESKIVLPPDFPAVIATSGPSLAREFLGPELCAAGDFDELIEIAPAIFEALCRSMPPATTALYVAGFSEKRRAFEVWYARSGEVRQRPERRPDNEIAPDFFRLVKVGGVGLFAQPAISTEHYRRGFEWPPLSVDDVRDVEAFALTILHLQREHVWGTEFGYSEDVHLVGGEGELTEISETSVTKRTICAWADP